MPESLIASLPSWVDLLAKGGGLVTVVIGAPIALYRYYKTRTYAPRVEISVAGQLLKADDQAYLQIGVRVKNIGQSKIKVSQDGSEVKVLTFKATPEPWFAIVPEELCNLDLLAKHKWIESGETIEDLLLVKVPHENILGFYIDVVVSSLKQNWSQSAIVSCILKPE